MLSDLLMIVSGPRAAGVLDFVPPSVRRPVLSPHQIRRDGADVVVECPPLVSRQPGRHFVPSFSALTTADYSFRFEAAPPETSADWVGTTTIGAATFASIPSASPTLRSDIDLFLAGAALPGLRLRLRLRASDPEVILASRWTVTLSVCDGVAPDGPPSPGHGSARIAVPALSQFEQEDALRDRVCSPTSVAMVLGWWARATTVGDLAAEMFHPGLGLYGVWLPAVRAAARRGVPGYLLRFPDWAAAAWCLEHGLPIVASVRYEAGELTGAAIGRTPGHLLVLTGFDGDHVLVNDPAAGTGATVGRRYRLDEVWRVWLNRVGVGYVFCPPVD